MKYALIAYLVMSALVVAYAAGKPVYVHRNTASNDIQRFTAAARVVTNGNTRVLYDHRPGSLVFRGCDGDCIVGGYFNPPAFAVFFYPLAKLTPLQAQWGMNLISVAGAAGIALLSLAWWKDWRAAAITGLAILSFYPFYAALFWAQPATLLSLLSGLALLVYVRGKNHVALGLLVGLLGLKPSVAAFPLALLAWRNRKAFLVAAAFIIWVVLLPLVLAGALTDYIAVVRTAGEDAWRLKTPSLTAGAFYMPNWQGFWARLLTDDPPRLPVYLCSVLTLLLVARVFMVGSKEAAWLASALGTTILIPHMLAYDWILVVPAGMALALKERDRGTMIGLVALHMAVNLTAFQMPVDKGPSLSFGLYPAPVIGTLLLAYLGFGEKLRRRRLGGVIPAPVLSGAR